MKTRWGLVFWLVLPLILLACSDNSDSRLSFDNQAECGTATITLTHTGTGSIQEHSLAQGERLDVKVDHGVEYRYEITYEGDPAHDLACDPKSGSVMVPRRGQSANFRLQSATATPEPQ